MWVCRLPVHIVPAEQTVYTEICGEFATSSRADVGIGPYKREGKHVQSLPSLPAT